MSHLEKENATAIHANGEDDVGLKGDAADHAVYMPESIRNMDDQELNVLRKKMVRKMDAVIMPIMGILYILNYVDRSALAATKVYGIMDDLGMNNQQFATAISILFGEYSGDAKAVAQILIMI